MKRWWRSFWWEYDDLIITAITFIGLVIMGAGGYLILSSIERTCS